MTLALKIAGRNLLASLNRHDPLGCGAAFTENAVLTASNGGRFEGRQAIEQYFRALFVAFPDLVIEIRTLITPEATTTMVEYVLKGTHLGPYPLAEGRVAAPSGNAVNVQLFQTASFNASGQITAMTVEGDLYPMLRQVGVLAAPHMTAEQRIAKVNQLISAYNERDMEQVIACFTPNGTIGSDVLGEIRGIEQSRRMWEANFRAYPEGKLIVNSIVCDDVTVVAKTRLNAVDSGEVAWRSSTGKALDLPMTLVCDVGPMGIFGMRMYYDQVTISRQLGFLK